MKYYAVFDTNVLVSAMITVHADSPTVKVLEMVADDRIVPLFNSEIFVEYDEVLHRDKFNLRENDIVNMLELMLAKGIPSHRIPTIEPFIDADDVVFYEIALSKEDAYLVTGNIKHFPQTPIVVTPLEMLEIVEKQM